MKNEEVSMGSDKKTSHGEELARQHTEWFIGLIQALNADAYANNDDLVIGAATLIYVYRTAFLHGYGHGRENAEQPVKIGYEVNYTYPEFDDRPGME